MKPKEVYLSGGKVYLDGKEKKSFDLGKAIRTGAVRPFTSIGVEVERKRMVVALLAWKATALVGWSIILIACIWRYMN